MMRPSVALLALVVVRLAADVSFAAPAELYVAPNGDDAATGTRDQPVATVGAAVRKARELRRTHDARINDGVRVILRGGVHRLATPLVLRPEDSGTSTSPTVIEAADGERAILSGGITVTDWKRAGDVADLPASARGHVWVSAPVVDAGRPRVVRELWTGERKATRARTPNDPQMSQLTGWDRKAEVAIVPWESLGGRRRAEGVEVVLEQQWEVAFLRLRAIEPMGNQARIRFEAPESALEFAHPWPQPILPPKGGGAFFLVNAIEFLDAPGEWYQDPRDGRIYYWPFEEADPNRADITVPNLTTLVQVDGSLDRPVTQVVFRNVGFAHSAWDAPTTSGHVPLQAGMAMTEAYKLAPKGTPYAKGLDNLAWIQRLPAAVTVTAGDHIGFERCTFEHTAASALDLARGTRDSLVVGCRFTDIGGNGVQLGSFQEGAIETHVPYQPADEREVCARIHLANNVLRDTANADWGCVAIIAGYARELVIEHNDIANTSYTGISIGWGWTPVTNASRDNRITGNKVRHLATRVCDTAGIYLLSAQQGTVVAENVVDDMAINKYVDRPQHWFYLYTDEGSSGIALRDNWCAEAKFLQNANGPGNVWGNNGPNVSPDIKQRAGLEPAYQDLLETAEIPRSSDHRETKR